MLLSERLTRTARRQDALGRGRVAEWYLDQRGRVLASGQDREHPPLRGVIERYQRREGFVTTRSGARAPSAVHLTE